MADARSSAGDVRTHLTSFVGRSSELAEVRGLLHDTRLLTLTGPGGSGKSRLAERAATQERARFLDGVWWVELAPIGDPGLVAAAVAQVLGVRPMPGQSELEAVISFLESRTALLVLDNCEHVLHEAARVAEAVARRSPNVRIAATSREPLGAEGEAEWRVPSLSLPPSDPGDVSARPSDAVRLFVERARQVRPHFDVTPDNAAAIVAICRGLDGMPLAIELAAARLRAFSVDQIAGALADRFRLLTGGTRTAHPRHRTLYASVDWSHELLTPEERAVFRRLGVFMDGFTLDAAEAVCRGDDIEGEQVPDLLVKLVEKSLVQAEERRSTMRYRLLETVRQYAIECLEVAGETDEVRDRHLDVFLELAERAEPELTTPRQPVLLEVLDPEAANFTVAIERAAATAPKKALRLSVALTLWWRVRSHFAQGEAAFVRALGAESTPSDLRCRALWGRALLLTFGGAWGEALPAAQRAYDAAEAASDDSTAARSLWLLGVAIMWPDPIASRPGLERARHLAAASGDDLGLMHATQALGMTYTFQEDTPRAAPLQGEALELAELLGQQDAVAFYWVARMLAAWVAGDAAELRDAAGTALTASRRAGDIVTESLAVCGIALADVQAGDPGRALEKLAGACGRAAVMGGLFVLPALEWGTGLAYAAGGRLEESQSALENMIGQGANGWAALLTWGHVLLAEVRRLLGDAAGAERAASDGLELAHRIGNRPRAAEAKLVLGRVAAGRSDWAAAQPLLHEALVVATECGTPRPASVLEALAEVAAGIGSHAQAARLIGAASRLRDEPGRAQWPHHLADAAALEAGVREALDADAFERLLAEGGSSTLDEVVAYVQRARGPRKRPPAGWASLTPTELEVSRHAASGLSNVEIAERMFISPGTVRTHLTHIFAKIGIKNRSQLTREVARQEDFLER